MDLVVLTILQKIFSSLTVLWAALGVTSGNELHLLLRNHTDVHKGIELLLRPRNLTGILDDYALFLCLGIHYHQPWWTKDGENIENLFHTPKFKVLKYDYYFTKLQINSLTLKDQGYYKCHMDKNGLLISSNPAFLQVIKPLERNKTVQGSYPSTTESGEIVAKFISTLKGPTFEVIDSDSGIESFPINNLGHAVINETSSQLDFLLPWFIYIGIPVLVLDIVLLSVILYRRIYIKHSISKNCKESESIGGKVNYNSTGDIDSKASHAGPDLKQCTTDKSRIERVAIQLGGKAPIVKSEPKTSLVSFTSLPRARKMNSTRPSICTPNYASLPRTRSTRLPAGDVKCTCPTELFSDAFSPKCDPEGYISYDELSGDYSSLLIENNLELTEITKSAF